METVYWYESCSACKGQGRLLIQEDVTNGRLYLHCEECEMGWLDPAEVKDSKKGFLTLQVDFESRNPTPATLAQFGWTKYAKHEINS